MLENSILKLNAHSYNRNDRDLSQSRQVSSMLSVSSQTPPLEGRAFVIAVRHLLRRHLYHHKHVSLEFVSIAPPLGKWE